MAGPSRWDLLREARRRAGLTQEVVAERAELSVRTVRMLESGQADSPRPGSLVRFIDALEPGPVERRALLASWGIDRGHSPLTLEQLWDPNATDYSLRAMMNDHFDDAHTVAVTASARMDVDGRILTERFDRVVQADRDGVSLLVHGVANEKDVRIDLQFEDLDGVALARYVEDPATNWAIYFLALPRPLRRGELYSYAVTTTNLEIGGGSTYVIGHGFSRRAASCVLRATFHGGNADCRYVTRESMTGPTTTKRTLGTGMTTAQVIIDHPEPGWHGLTWSVTRSDES